MVKAGWAGEGLGGSQRREGSAGFTLHLVQAALDEATRPGNESKESSVEEEDLLD